jgi:hypothetical protein
MRALLLLAAALVPGLPLPSEAGQGRGLAAGPSALADGTRVEGDYESPLGRVRVTGRGGSYRGVLVAASDICGFQEGDEVLRATLLDDSLAGQVRVCLAGKACKAKDEWSSAVLLASGERLSGAVHVATKGCKAPLGKNGGVAFVRVAGDATAGSPAVPPERGDDASASERSRRAATPTPTASSTAKATPTSKKKPDGAARAKAREILRDGAAWLQEGNFESARRRFLEAIELDEGIPEAYNGVGVTYRMRNDLPRALEWYKKSLTVDPDFGDAYYNMACVYAIEGQKEMALRYLQIAAMNGYATAEGIDGDPDLEGIRGEAGYRALVRAKM